MTEYGHPETWEEYDEDRALWLSRLMFGWMLGLPPLPAPDLPTEQGAGAR